MEPDHQPTEVKNDQETPITTQPPQQQQSEVKKEIVEKSENELDKKTEDPAAQEPTLPETEKTPEEKPVEEVPQKSPAADEIKSETKTPPPAEISSSVDEVKNLPENEDPAEKPSETEVKPADPPTEKVTEPSKPPPVKVEEKKSESEAEKPKLPLFPGTVKSYPGSNDVKLEIDSQSLMHHVIVSTLKKTEINNSRLDAARNKYLMNNGNANSSFNSNSNGSDSNSSSKSVEKIIEEFKDGCSKARGTVSPTNNPSPSSSSAVVESKSDISKESTSNGAETCAKPSNSSSSVEVMVKENHQNVITSSQGADLKSVESSPRDVHRSNETSENEALDFREKSKEVSPITLDLTIPHRDEKSVPIIKRNHGLYHSGLPDFSKQIFTAPTISRPTTTTTSQSQPKPQSSVGPPKIRNPDFSALPRSSAPELQMRHPDFSKGFSRTPPETPPASMPVTPSNFPEIVRKNNYISDLQLKHPPTGQSVPQSSSSSTSASSYKIDYRSSAAISQKLLQESKPEQSSTANIVYPNMKKEGINAYNQQQLIIDEPMPHIIHKNQFLPHPSEAPQPPRVGGWSDRGERLLGGSLASAPKPELDGKPLYHNSSEDLRRSHPAYYQHPYKEREFNNNNQESHNQMTPHEFSLKQKEQQLRQEGTIITIKNEPTRTPTREMSERRSADLFREMKLKQPKESPDSMRRADYPPLAYQQQYPDMPPSAYAKNVHLKPETIAKANHTPPAAPLAFSQERHQKQMPTSSRSYHSPSPVTYPQPKSPLTVPPGPSLMNPPQNWPPPLVMQQPTPRHAPSPGGPMSSPSPTSYHHASPSQSPHLGYPYSAYPVPPSQSHAAPKINHQSYQSYPGRGPEVKEVPNRHYPGTSASSSSSSSTQGYYHQKYPDFSRHPETERKPPSHEQNLVFGSGSAQPHPPEVKYHRFPPHQELEIRTVREPQPYRQDPGPSYYQQSREHPEYPPRVPEQHLRHPEAARRVNEEPPRGHQQPIKIEHRMDEPPRIIAGPSNLPLRRPEPTEVSVIAKVKIEPVSAPRNPPQSTSQFKPTKSIFAEVKRESPLDLSVKTVKTKADSTGCEQDLRMQQRPEPSGLKVEFSPNFDKIAQKTDCRSQARLGPQDYPSRSSSLDRTAQTSSQKYSKEQVSRTPPTAPPQQAVPSSSRPYYDPRYPPQNELERPRAPMPDLPNSSQYPNRPVYQHPVQHNRQVSPMPINQVYPRPEDKQRAMPYYPPAPHPPQHGTPPAQNHYPHPNKPSHVSHTASIEASRAPNPIPPQHMQSRNPLYNERERDRKYVEELLKGRTRPAVQPELRHFQQVPSPPRKRVIEHQQQPPHAVPPKQVRVADLPPMPSHPVPPLHYQQQYDPHRQQKVENHVRNLQSMGHPPALVKNEQAYPKHLSPSEMKYYHDTQKEVVVKSAHQPYAGGQYYPNPKAEMIHRSDPSSSFKHDRVPYPNQNFQQRPDDNTLQVYPRIHHPIPQASDIKIEHQAAGPLPGSSGESARPLVNGLIPAAPGVSGSNGNIARGADQSTIMKLKSNLEMKEQMKQISKCDISDDLEKKDLSPRQFRSKGELKAFVPLPTTVVASSTSGPSALPSGPSAFDLLDWGSACNDFVQQLETGKKKIKKKRPMSFNSGEDKSTSDVPGTTTTDFSEVPKDVMNSIARDQKNSSSEDEKPLVELVNPETGKAHSQVVDKISEKISRNAREKQRLELEQKMAARLGKPSSSESETDNRRQARPAKRVRRLRKRAALGIKKTDEELSVEEEEAEEELAQRRRCSKSASKIDDPSSSEDEEKSKDKKSDSKHPTKASRKVLAQKSEVKKEDSTSESSESDESTTIDKINKLSSPKNAKKLKDLGDGANIKNMLEEEKTMTRSKRKLEIEKTLSNSKVLRNEKVVKNVSPDKKSKVETTPPSNKKVPPKRKDSAKSEDSKRKVVESDSDTTTNKSKKKRTSKVESSSSEEESQEEEIKADRLRPRKSKPETDTPPAKPGKDSAKKKSDEKAVKTEENPGEGDAKQSVPCRIPFSGMFPFKDDKTSRFTPGWEADTYNFKRSLKIPAGLITIGRPPQHGISHSLPDLDPQTSDTSEIFSEFVKSKDKESKSNERKGKATSTPKPSPPAKKSSSIIDLLHERVVQKKLQKIRNKKAAASGSSAQNAADDDELLPTPEKESEKVFGFKRNIFETSIMTSRLRNENNALRKREMLKEVFGAADERPRSAPPTGAKEDETEKEEGDAKISYEEKYREYLEKMNMDFPPKTGLLKLEDSKAAEVKEEDEDDDDESVVASEKDLLTNPLKGKSKKSRTRRCKGSSGFDYIRKKKKPSSNASENPMSVNNIIKKRLAAMENLETKDENDIVKEIKGWVLNKGVGESVLHKASRLDYADVIAYCLERMKMNPDTKDNAGYTPLHEACSRGHLEIARTLLQYGANHSEAAQSGIRPLHEAIENGHVEIVRLLISYGADPCLATYSGQLPIAMAEDKEMEDFLSDYLIDIGHKGGKANKWFFEGPYSIEDPSEEGYEVFEEIPINKTDLGSSVASVFSTSLTSLVTATTQMSDNETVASETTATPIKAPATPMKAPSQDLIKYKMKKCDTNSNNLVMNDTTTNNHADINNKAAAFGKKTKSCSVILNNIDSAMKKIKKLPAIPKQETPPKLSEPIQKLEEIKHKEDYDDMVDGDHIESDNEFLELEESDAPLPPLYLLKDEGSDKWLLLSDLCSLLKVKSKEAVLKHICPSSPPSVNKELIRELKMSDFLEKAICLQLFCAGEKLNVRASKVSLVRYNDSVKNLLGVQTIRMNM